MLETNQLSKAYEKGGRLALDRLDLRIAPGEIYCLLGANGAGKTTTINLFLNFIEPTSGEAFICGIDTRRRPLAAKRKVAFLPESVMLYLSFTARQNLDFFARIGGVPALSREDGDRLLGAAGLASDTYDKALRNFSKGMRQKVALAICMAKDSPTLILDEPLAGLDPVSAHDLMCTLIDLKSRGKTILMSTHDVFRARELANRVGILKDGVKILELSRTELDHADLGKIYLDFMKNGRAAGQRRHLQVRP